MATVICHFGDRDFWTVEDMGNEIGMDVTVVRRKLKYWVNQGVLSESNGGYTTVESVDSSRDNDGKVMDDEEVEENDDAREEEGVYTQFILGMLGNTGPQGIDRIDNMLRMFVTTPVRYDLNVDGLRKLLTKLVREEVLEENGGLFSKPNS